MRLLYKPFAIIAAIAGAKLGQSVFKSLWAKLDGAEPPRPTTAETSLSKVVGAAALEAATTAGVAAAVDRATARAFHHLTGIWPGKQEK
jgi:predicted DNA-binding transcriptional regulator YafY